MSAMALKNVKVFDLSWMVGLPLATTWMADHGAQVVKAESITRPDGNRMFPPPKDGKPGLNRGVSFAGYNRNKYGAALDLSTAKGMEVVKRFIAWADVFAESFPLDVVKKWGLTYEEVVKINPSIIMVASNMQGGEGPSASLPGFGVQLSGLAGFANLTGWPDRTPLTSTAYTDNIVAISSAA
ncbi:MAG: CoA transferase, partial [Dehalococcoidia bacterium]